MPHSTKIAVKRLLDEAVLKCGAACPPCSAKEFTLTAKQVAQKLIGLCDVGATDTPKLNAVVSLLNPERMHHFVKLYAKAHIDALDDSYMATEALVDAVHTWLRTEVPEGAALFGLDGSGDDDDDDDDE